MYVVDHRHGEFNPLSANDRRWQDPFVVHRRETKSTGNLVLFVHGLGGQAEATWGSYPEFVFLDEPHLDVGLFDYESGARRRARRSISPNKHAEVLAHSIRDARYDRVVLVGHSLGGLVCKAAIKELIVSDSHSSDGFRAIDKVVGLVLFATPQAGSTRVPGWLTRYSKDARALRVHSEFVTEMVRCLQDRVVTQINWPHPTNRQRIPTFAIVPSADRWVDHFSAVIGIDNDQQKIVAGSHTSIVNPKSRSDDAYMWFKLQVERCVARATEEETAGATRPGLSPRAHKPQTNEARFKRLLSELLRIAAEADVPLHTNKQVDAIGETPMEEDTEKPKDQGSS